MRKNRIAPLAFGLFVSAALAASAAPPKLPSANPVVTYTGAIDLHTEGNTVIVALRRGADGAVDTIFHVDARDAVGLPLVLRSEAAQVIQWNGHLVVLAPDEHQALHFSAPGFPAKVRVSLNGGAAAERLDPATIDARLEASYRLTTLDTAVEIGARTGALPAIQLDDEKGQAKWLATSRPPLKRQTSPMSFDPVYQDPWSGGSANCSTSCSTTCGNGATCSVNCGQQNANNPQVCAHCTCPVSCSCT